MLKLLYLSFIKAIALFLPEPDDRFYPVLSLDNGDRFVLWRIERSPLSCLLC
ncbi:hypothetical protein H6G77_28950 [Aulosira sp. FACHB-615]|nr:hypothetical protein [Aulosira sp. FACHB-615]